MKDPTQIAEAIRAASAQVDIAVHYQIPYPRPHYVDPGTVGGDNDFRRRSARGRVNGTKSQRSSVSKQFRTPRK